MHRNHFSAFVFALLSLSSMGCRGGGQYGHSPKYIPLDDEALAVAQAREYDPVMYTRRPEEWKKGTVNLFGIVRSRGTTQTGLPYVQLGVRRLEPRNLCDNQNDDDSCRVTIGDRDYGVVYATLTLKGEDDIGEHSVGPGSLLRLVGKIGNDVDPIDGGPVLHATYSRHWPRNFYVTKGAAADMRQ